MATDLVKEKIPSEDGLLAVIEAVGRWQDLAIKLGVPVKEITLLENSKYGGVQALKYWKDGKSGKNYPVTCTFLLEIVGEACGRNIAEEIEMKFGEESKYTIDPCVQSSPSMRDDPTPVDSVSRLTESQSIPIACHDTRTSLPLVPATHGEPTQSLSTTENRSQKVKKIFDMYHDGDLRLPSNPELEDSFDDLMGNLNSKLSSAEPQVIAKIYSVVRNKYRWYVDGVRPVQLPQVPNTCNGLCDFIQEKSTPYEVHLVYHAVEILGCKELKTALEMYNLKLATQLREKLTSCKNRIVKIPYRKDRTQLACVLSKEEVLLSVVLHVKKYFAKYLQLEDAVFCGFQIACTVLFFSISSVDAAILAPKVLSHLAEMKRNFSVTYLIVFGYFVCDLEKATVELLSAPGGELQALREERTDLIAAMESSSRKSDQFRDDMMRLQVENDELKSTITKLKQIADEYMSSNLKLKLEEEEELKKANVELNRWRDECYKMVKKMERSGPGEELQALKEENKGYVTAIEYYSRQNDQFQRDMKQLQVENDELKSTITELKQIADEQRMSSDSELKLKEEELEKAYKEINRRDEYLKKMVKKMEHSGPGEELQALKEKKKGYVTAIEYYSRQNDQFQRDMKQLQVENDELKSTITELKQIADEQRMSLDLKLKLKEEELEKAYKEINRRDEYQKMVKKIEHDSTFFFAACKLGDIETVKTVISEDPTKLEELNETGCTPLMLAASEGQEKVLLYLIQQGADVYRKKGKTGDTALHFAARSNHIQCGILLVEAGANITLGNKFSGTPLDLARMEFKDAIMQTLSFNPKKIVCVVGNAYSGKTTLIASLQNENANLFAKISHRLFGVENISQRTAGIYPVSLSSRRYGDVVFFDFAGQHEYHGPHEMFLESILSKRRSTVTVIVVVKATNEESMISQQLDRWLYPVSKMSPSTNPIQVIVIGSYMDKVKSKAAAKEKLERCYERVRQSLCDVPLEFQDACYLDCRQPYSSDIEKLCTYLNEVPIPEYKATKMPYSICWVISRMKTSLDSKAIRVADFSEWIERNKNNLPTNLPPVEEVCKDLMSTGHFLYLSNREELSNGWLVLDLPSILHEVYGTLFSPSKKIVNKFGLFTCRKLPYLFPTLDERMVRDVLISLEFCIEVDLSILVEEVTQLTESTDEGHEHLFFPALVSSQPPKVFTSSQPSYHVLSWQLLVNKKPFISPRLLQTIILRLAARHVFHYKQGPDTREHYCSVWSTGIFWQSPKDVIVAVQISDSTVVELIGRSKARPEVLCSYISTIAGDISATIRELSPTLSATAYIIHPADPQVLLENPRSPSPREKFPVDFILESIRNFGSICLSCKVGEEPATRKPISDLFCGFVPNEDIIGHLSFVAGTTAPRPTQVFDCEAFMDKFKERFLQCVDSHAIVLRLEIEKVISKELSHSIKNQYVGDGNQELFLYLQRNADPGSIRKLCDVMVREESYFMMNELGRDIRRELDLLTDSKLNTPTDPFKTTPINPFKTTPTDLLTTPTTRFKTTYTDPLLTIPPLHELNRQVIPHVCLDWQSVGYHLEVHPSVMKVIDDKYHDDVEKCCRTMFTRWLSHDEGTGGAPRLWRTVLKALKNVGYTSLVGDVERTLFGQI